MYEWTRPYSFTLAPDASAGVRVNSWTVAPDPRRRVQEVGGRIGVVEEVESGK